MQNLLEFFNSLKDKTSKKGRIQHRYFKAEFELSLYMDRHSEQLGLKPSDSPVFPTKFLKLVLKVENAKALAKEAGFDDLELERVAKKAHYDALMLSPKQGSFLVTRWKSIGSTEQVVILLSLVGLVSALVGYFHKYPIYQHSPAQHVNLFLQEYTTNIVSEFVGIAITVLLIDRINRKRDTEYHIRQLLRQIKHRDLDDAMVAFVEIVEEGYLRNGQLERVNMSSSNLPGVYFHASKLRGADLSNSILNNTHWQGADLQQVNFTSANLSGAEMYGANLVGATFVKADLRGVIFKDANLLWASFREEFDAINSRTGEKYVHVMEAVMDENTILPDGRRWSPEIDLNYFTKYRYAGGNWKERNSSEFIEDDLSN